MTIRIDLNSDVGESFGAWTMGHDEMLMPSITSANVACGFHAGDPGVMRHTVRMARTHGVAVGAHPGFPDLVGFGRREIRCSPQEVEDLVLYQVGALAAVAHAEGVRLQHVKAHGALYNMACRDESLAGAIARATAALDRSLVLFGLPGSALLEAGRAQGLRVAAEGFADRTYNVDGSLVSRNLPGSVIHDEATVVARTVQMARHGTVATTAGSVMPLRIETVCVHGDTPGSARLAAAIRRALQEEGVRLEAVASGSEL
jgi:UPF0271 protein